MAITQVKMKKKKKTMFEKVSEYVEYKNNLGVELKGTELWNFAKFADAHAPGKPLTTSLAIRWANSARSTKRTSRARRINTLRPLAKYLLIADSKTELIPRRMLGPSRSRFTPYIYSSEEIARLLTANAWKKPFRLSKTNFTTVIGLLACTGMRIGEVLSLKRKDIDYEKQTITIIDSKRKTRTIPIDKSAVEKLREYEKKRECAFCPPRCDYFFVSSCRGGQLQHRELYVIWKKTLRKTRIGENSRNGPRIHDFRHTFACNHLLHAYRTSQDIDVAVYYLSVYLGHSKIENTYWYLTGTPELMEACAKKYEQYIKKQEI